MMRKRRRCGWISFAKMNIFEIIDEAKVYMQISDEVRLAILNYLYDYQEEEKCSDYYSVNELRELDSLISILETKVDPSLQ